MTEIDLRPSSPAAARSKPDDPRAQMGRVFTDLPREHGFERCEIEGTIPSSLRGMLLRNGPGVFSSFGREYDHWFDGDGVIQAFRFDGGRVEGAARVTVSPELAEERTRGRMLYSSGFTTGPIWHKRLMARAKNTASINVLAWQERLFAIADASLPLELDPATLETCGPTKLEGALRQTLGAHYRPDVASGNVYACGMSFGMKMELDVYELPSSGAARHLVSVPLRGMPAMIHDFAIAGRNLVVFVHPVMLKLLRPLLGLCAPPNAIEWRPDAGTEVIVIPIDHPERIVRFPIPAFFHFHYANAFEQDGKIIVDLCPYDAYTAADAMTLANLRSGRAWSMMGTAKLERATIYLARGTCERRSLADDIADFPMTDPRKQGLAHRYVYFQATRGARDFIASLDVTSGRVQIGDAGPLRFPGEPTFVAYGPAERDGHLLAYVYDAAQHRSGVCVFDAAALERGPLGFAWLDHHVPYPLHGCWVPQR